MLAGGCAGKSTGDEAQSDPCPDVCAKGRKCPNAPPISVTCDDFCLGNDAVAEDTGCHDLYVKSTQCSAKLADVCTADKDCRDEILAAYTCEHNYCSAHPGDQICVNVM